MRTEILGSESALQQTSTLVLTRQGVTHDTIPALMQRWPDAYANEVRDFVSCTLEDRAPSVTDEDARRATAIGMAATLSLDEARPVLVSEVG